MPFDKTAPDYAALQKIADELANYEITPCTARIFIEDWIGDLKAARYSAGTTKGNLVRYATLRREAAMNSAILGA